MKRYYVFDSTHSPLTVDHDDQREAFDDFMSREHTIDSYIALGIYKGMSACDILISTANETKVSADHVKLNHFNGAEELIIIDELKRRLEESKQTPAMTYYALLCLETKDNEEIDPTYTRAHLNVSECYPSADDGAKWDDPADPATLKAVTTDRQ